MRNTAIYLEYRELFNSNGPIRLLYSVLVYNKTPYTYFPYGECLRTSHMHSMEAIWKSMKWENFVRDVSLKFNILLVIMASSPPSTYMPI